MAQPRGPLAGVKVVACSTAQAGTVPYMLMADLGAEVIKIEVPGVGDGSRRAGRMPGFPSTYFETNNRGVQSLITTQVVLGVLGFLVSLGLAWAMVAASRRQTEHFRSLVTSSTDLVLVFGTGGCRYASQSVTSMLGRPDQELLGEGIMAFVHAEDRALLRAAYAPGEPPSAMVFRMCARNPSAPYQRRTNHSLRARKRSLRQTRLNRGQVYRHGIVVISSRG